MIPFPLRLTKCTLSMLTCYSVCVCASANSHCVRTTCSYLSIGDVSWSQWCYELFLVYDRSWDEMHDFWPCNQSFVVVTMYSNTMTIMNGMNELVVINLCPSTNFFLSVITWNYKNRQSSANILHRSICLSVCCTT